MKSSKGAGPSVPLVVDPSAEPTEYRLLELPPEILALLENGGEPGSAVLAGKGKGKRKREDEDDKNDSAEEQDFEWDTGKRILTINGRYLDDAAVCTSSRTYNLRHVSQSNSFLLCALLPAADVPLAPAAAAAAARATARTSREASPASDDSAVLLGAGGRGAAGASGSGSGSNPGSGASASAGAGAGAGAVLSLKCSVKDTLELQWAVPRLERIAALLGPSAYRGPDEEARRLRALKAGKADAGDPGNRLYTMKEVRSVVQASAVELAAGLDAERVVELGGHARLVDRAYLARAVLPALLNHADLHALPLDAVPLDDAVDALVEEHGTPRPIARRALTRWFARRNGRALPGAAGAAEEEEEDDDSDEEGAARRAAKGKGRVRTVALDGRTVALDGRAIARTIGLDLLASSAGGGQHARVDEFMSRWAQATGDALVQHVDLRLLEGEHLLHPAPPAIPRASAPLRISFYPSCLLPLEPAARFQALFAARAQWTRADLLPFIARLATDDNRRDALLIKFARASSVPVPRPLGAGAGADGKRGGIEAKLAASGAKIKRSGNQKEALPQEMITVYSARLRY